MKFKTILLLILLLTMQKANAQSNAKYIIKQLNAAFSKKAIDEIKAALSSDFSVAAYSKPTADKCLQAILEKYGSDSVQLKNETTQGDKHILTILPFNNGRAEKESFIYTDKDYKILYADIFDQPYGMNRYQKSSLKAKIPFEIDNGSIILSVKVNNSDRILKLVFDTGADGMAITKALADAIGMKVNRQQNTSVVGGNMEISVSTGNTVRLDSFLLKNQSFALFPEMHKGSDGIIGNSVAKNYITIVDFDKKELSLYDFGDYQYNDQGNSVPVKMPSGLFIIPGEVTVTNGQTHSGNFVFDTGAAYHLICFRPFVKKNRLLVSGFKPEYNGVTTSMGVSTPTYSGKAAGFSFANMPKLTNFPITLMAGGGQSESWNPGFDGSIGIRTIGKYNFTINMQRKEIHFSPNHTMSYPNDFVIGNYLLGFNEIGKLKVLSVIAVEDKPGLALDATINNINGISDAVLLKDSKKVNQILSMPAGTDIKVSFILNGKAQTTIITKK